MKDALLISSFFSKNSELFNICEIGSYDCSSKLIDELLNIDIKEYIFGLLIRDSQEIIPSDIPVFSKFKDCTIDLCLVLDAIQNKGITMLELGKILLEYDANDMAYYKYGESHAKSSSILGLTLIKKDNGVSKVYLTSFGEYYILNKNKREMIINRLLLRTKIISEILRNYYMNINNVEECMHCLSKKTMVRRMSNVKKYLTELSKSSEFNFQEIFDDLIFTCSEE